MSVEIVKDSYVFVKPFKFDVEYSIVPFLKSCPFQHGNVYEETMHVTLCRAKQPLHNLELQFETVYNCTISGAQEWLSPVTKKSNLVITLDSEDLRKRREEILKGTEDFYPNYQPHITVMYDLPSKSADTRWWINDILNKFNQGPNSRYFGNTIRLAGESVGNSVLMPVGYKSHLSIRPEL